MSKFERAIQKGDCFKIMMGINMVDAFIEMMRARIIAEKESFEDWFGKVDERYQLMLSSYELSLKQMLNTLDFDTTLQHWTHVESGLQQEMPSDP